MGAAVAFGAAGGCPIMGGMALATLGVGLEIAGTGCAVPQRVVTNSDLESLMETSDEWIRQRTGIEQRYMADRENGETPLDLARMALLDALEDAGAPADSLDLVIVATMSQETICPPTACRLIEQVGGKHAGGFDLVGACSGYVFGVNTLAGLMKTGPYRTAALVGVDVLTRFCKFDTQGRSTSVLFGDAAAATVFRRTDDTTKGPIAQSMHTDGSRWSDLAIPMTDVGSAELETTVGEPTRLNTVHMNGRGVFKFAVSTFSQVIEETLEKADLASSDVAHYVCHQSNARILASARDRFGMREEQLHINVNRYANTVGASVPLVLNDLRRAGKLEAGQKIMFVAFGAGLTWGTSLWQI